MICKQLINIYLVSFNSCFLFSQLPQIGQNVSYFGVYVGCLEGISEVSGDCLGDSGYCLWAVSYTHLTLPTNREV